MSKRKHSYVPFYIDDWRGGTGEMPRLMWSVYFQVCLHNWDKIEPVTPTRLSLLLIDLPPEQGSNIIGMLVEAGHLSRDDKGNVFSERAMFEGKKAFDAWEAKSRGGKHKAPSKILPAKIEESSIEQEQDQDLKVPVGTAAAVDPVAELFKEGVAILVAAGRTDKQARSLIGKWRKTRDDGTVLTGLIECKARAISDPVEWLTKRFAGPKPYVSASGYEYRGTPEQVLREAEKRGDMGTYWTVKSDQQLALSKNKSVDSASK